MPKILTNTAQIDYQYEVGGSLACADVQTNAVTTSVVEPNLSALKTVSKSTYAPGERISYSIFVSNNSNSTAYDVTIKDCLSQYFTLVPCSVNIAYTDGTCSLIPESSDPNSAVRPTYGNIILGNCTNVCPHFGFKVGNIAPNENIMISFSVDISDTNCTADCIENFASIFYSNSACDCTPCSMVKTNVTTITKAYALLTATKIVDKPTVCHGDNLCYRIIINNLGNVDATNVRITDVLPSNFALRDVRFHIAKSPGCVTYAVEEENTLCVPASSSEAGFTVPANSCDNYIAISGVISLPM